jgi:hypothetical protein
MVMHVYNPVLGRPRQKNWEFETSPGYINTMSKINKQGISTYQWERGDGRKRG